MVTIHTNYLDSILRECMLTNPKLVYLMQTLISIAFQFCCLYENLDTSNHQETEIISRQAEEIYVEFSKNFRVFLEAIQYYSARDGDYYLGNLYQRLDYNSFYSLNTQMAR